MPLAFHPSESVWIVLDNDKDLPEPKPAFQCHYLTVAEVRRVQAGIDTAGKVAESGDKLPGDILADTVCIGVFGWRGIVDRDGKTVAFSRGALLDVLTVSELWELAGQTVRDTRLAEADRKKSASRSGTPGAGSAVVPATPAPSPVPQTTPTAAPTP